MLKRALLISLLISLFLTVFTLSVNSYPTTPVPLSGTRTTDSDISATHGWKSSVGNGFQISWLITPYSSGDWAYKYEYWISGHGSGDKDPLSKDLSHIIIQVSDGVTTSDFCLPMLPQYKEKPELGEWSGSQSSNPGMPGKIPGIKFEAKKNALTFYFWFYTDRSPMWGNFYAKDGGGTDLDKAVYAYNIGFKNPTNDTDVAHFIAVPDTGTPPIPEPGTLILIGSGLIGIAGYGSRLKFSRKKR